MKKSYLFLTGIIAVVAVIALFSDAKNDQTYVSRADVNVKQEATGAMEHYNLLRADPVTGIIDQEAVLNVSKAMQKLPINANKNSGYNWISHGPDNIGGRTRALHVYKEDPNKMLAGSVTGGLYKSTNAGATWTRAGYNDNSAVASVTRLGNGTIYVGSGTSHESTQGDMGSGIIGHGLFKSTDDGETFTNVFEPDGLEFAGGVWSVVDEVIASPIDDNIVWVAYGGGLATYNDVTGEFIDKISFMVDDFDISNDGQGIIAVRGSEIRVSQDGGDTFINRVGNDDGEIPSSGGRKVVAISPDDKNYMYVTTTAGGSLAGVFASKNGGSHFSRIANDSEGGTNPFFSPFGSNRQGWYDNALTVKPNSPGVIILGGIRLYRWTMSPSSTDTNINGGWDAISSLGYFPTNNSYVHADIHSFEWDSNGIFYTGCDGGVFRSYTQAVTGFYNLNRDYRTSQFYGIGFNATGNLFGGMQDNGTMVIPGTGGGGNTPFEAVDIGGGDGFDVELSQERLLVFSASQYNNINFAYYNFSGGGSGGPVGLKPGTFGEGSAPFYSSFKYYENMLEWQAPSNLEYIVQDSLFVGETLNYTSATFSEPLSTVLNNNYFEGDTLYLFDPVQTLFAYGTSSRLYITRNIVNNRLIPELDWAEYNINGTPISYEYSPDGDILYVGTTTGRIYRVSDLRTAYDVDALSALPVEQIYSGGSVITDLDLDPNDSNRLVASKGSYTGTSHVMYCEDAPNAVDSDDFTSIWNIDGFLINMPVYSVTFDGAAGSGRVLAGTEFGIFQTDDLGATQWTECNSGEMYRVPVYDLRQQNKEWDVLNHNVIYAGTHGAGIFSAGDFNITGVEEIADQIDNSSLNLMIYPNPVSEIGKFDLSLTNARYVTVEIFNTYGKHVRSINKGKVNQGKSTLSFDVQDLATGTYILVINVEGEQSQTGKFVVTK